MRTLLVALSILTCNLSFAKSFIAPQSGCLDCFNFIAPSVVGAENVSPAETGLIVFDSYRNRFSGYDGVRWQKLSTESAIKNVTTNSSVYFTDDIILVDASTGDVNLTLPAVSTGAIGKKISIKKIDSTLNKITIAASDYAQIDGSTNVVVNRMFDVVELVNTGSAWVNIAQKPAVAPIVRTLSGTGTYTTPVGVSYIRVKLAGAGGGGAGSSVATTADGGKGGTGGITSFGTSLLAATGGYGGSNQAGTSGGAAGGAGGSGTIGGGSNVSATLIYGAPGINGTATGAASARPSPGTGGSSSFGGGAKAPEYGSGNTAGYASGGGGSGAGTSSSATTNGNAGGGGGGGGYIEAVITSPDATYNYIVGSGGAAGSAGTSGFAGGAGADGGIIVEEYY